MCTAMHEGKGMNKNPNSQENNGKSEEKTDRIGTAMAEASDIKVVRKYGGDWMFPRWELAVCSEQSGSPHGAQNEKY